MTQRFDRLGSAQTGQNEKLHMLSLGALRHFDFNQPRGYAYEQILETIRRLGLGRSTLEQMVRRAIVNVVIRNQDDHVKNTSFLMDKSGSWRLAPAYDVVHAHNPEGLWTNAHQMTINARSDDFELEDLRQLGRMADLKKRQTDEIIREVESAASRWDEFAETAAVPRPLSERARDGFRSFLG
jgi:serine/threonine-protein kinase HipA